MVFDAVLVRLHEFDRCFEVVEEAVYICQEYLTFATGLEKLRELIDRDEITAVRTGL